MMWACNKDNESYCLSELLAPSSPCHCLDTENLSPIPESEHEPAILMTEDTHNAARTFLSMLSSYAPFPRTTVLTQSVLHLWGYSHAGVKCAHIK